MTIRGNLLGLVMLWHDEPSLHIGPTGRDEYGPTLYPPVTYPTEGSQDTYWAWAELDAER